jgi:hypothetical protein
MAGAAYAAVSCGSCRGRGCNPAGDRTPFIYQEKLEVSAVSTNHAWTEEELERAQELHSDGLPWSAIAETLDREFKTGRTARAVKTMINRSLYEMGVRSKAQADRMRDLSDRYYAAAKEAGVDTSRWRW